jgi:hypothetical protein
VSLDAPCAVRCRGEGEGGRWWRGGGGVKERYRPGGSPTFWTGGVPDRTTRAYPALIVRQDGEILRKAGQFGRPDGTGWSLAGWSQGSSPGLFSDLPTGEWGFVVSHPFDEERRMDGTRLFSDLPTGEWGFVVSHPFDEERRMDGAPGAQTLTLGANTKTRRGWGTPFRAESRSLPHPSEARTGHPAQALGYSRISLRGKWGFVVSHPFDEERRMDGALGAESPTLGANTKTRRGWGTPFRAESRSLPHPSEARMGHPAQALGYFRISLRENGGSWSPTHSTKNVEWMGHPALSLPP